MKVGEVSDESDEVVDERRRLLNPVRICKGTRTSSRLLAIGVDLTKGLPIEEKLKHRVAVVFTVLAQVSAGF